MSVGAKPPLRGNAREALPEGKTMDEKARMRADLQLQVNQALTRIRELRAERDGQLAVLDEARRQLAVLDNVPDIEGSFEFAAQRGGWD